MDGNNNPQQTKPPAGQSLESPSGPKPNPKQPAGPQSPQQTPQTPPQTPPQGSAPPQGPTAGQVLPDKGESSGKALWIGLVVIALLMGLGVGYLLGSV